MAAVTAIVLLAADNSEVARYSVAGAAATEASTGTELPKTLDWYRDATKWVVAASAGALVLGLGFFGETSSSWQRWIFSSVAVLLLVALAAGWLAHLWLLEFGKLWENRSRIDPADADTISVNETRQQRFLRRVRGAYLTLLAAFFAGMALFALGCGLRMWLAEPKHTFAVSVSGQPSQVLLINTGTGEVWVEARDVKGNAFWRRKTPPLGR